MTSRFSFKQLYLYGISAVGLIIGIIGVLQLGQHIVNLLLPDVPPPASPGSPGVPVSNLYDKRGIINSIVQILVAVPVYLYHWRQARRSESVSGHEG